MNGKPSGFTTEQVLDIKKRLKLHEENTPKELAKKHNVSLCVIYQIKEGKTYKNIK